MRPSRPIILLSTLAALATGCGRELTVPESDPTPPEVVLHVFGLGDTIDLEPGGADVSRTAPDDAEIVLIAVATDEDGGVKNITIQGAGTVRCSQDGVGQATSIHYIATNPEDPGVGVGDEAEDRRATNLHLTMSELRALCAEGFSFDSASGGFTATAENFHGGTSTTPLFSFEHPY